MLRLLFIDDDPRAQRALCSVLSGDYQVHSASSGGAGLEAVGQLAPDVVLLDIDLPDRDGLEVLEEINRRVDAPPVIMLTAYSDIRLVKQAIQAGACDYITKPYRLDELTGTIRRAVQILPARRSCPPEGEEALSDLVGESQAMREVRSLLLRFAPSEAPVLIQGESGTGKELAARAIHRLSPRRAGPLVALNCAAIPETLLESELFGVERGAYTDAVARPGSFEGANGGTLFLDEIGEMPPSAQAKLLRVLESKEITRVGGRDRVPLNVRFVSATHRDLDDGGAGRALRGDLYYRISVLPVRLPALRERAEDIPLLAVHFLAALGEGRKRFAPEALERLCGHPWPGNIRELRNVVERAALLCDGDLVRGKDVVLDGR